MKNSCKLFPILLIVLNISGCHPGIKHDSTLSSTQLPLMVTSPETQPADMEVTMGSESLFIIGAYYYPWYGPDRHWDSGYQGTPLLGEYDSSQSSVIAQHIAWAKEYGIDFFALSWWGQNSFEDKVIHGPFLEALGNNPLRFAILYESAGLLNLQDGKINLDNASIREQLVSDFNYLAKSSLQHPLVLKINNRPVIFLYLTRTFVGDISSAFKEAKLAVTSQGCPEPFIIGDEIYWQYPNQERINLFDGVTAYNMHTSVPNIADNFAENVERQYILFAKIAGQNGVDIIPNILPGFDDTAVRPEAHHPVIPRSVELFERQYNSAKKLAAGNPAIIMITSWNEWHEDTSIEPTVEEGAAYIEVLLNRSTP